MTKKRPKKQTLKLANVKSKKKVAKKRKKERRIQTRTAAPRSRSITVRAAGICIDLITAGEIVQEAVPGGPHDIDSTLEDAGLITEGERAVFRSDVVNKVGARGCSIDGDDVPNAATTTLRAARTAVQQNAH
jgi:hypothetical protein